MFAKRDTAERRFFRHACLINPCLLWNLSLHSLPEAWGPWERQHTLPALHYGCIMPIPSLQLQRSRGFGHRVVVSRTCWGIFRSPIVPCDHCKTLNNVGDWAFDHGGLEVGLPAFQLPMFAKCDCRCQEEICFAYFRLRNLNLHSLPVAWCSWELVFYSLPPPVHHGDSFAAKELLSPLLSPRTIFAHRIQSTAGRIWPLIDRFDHWAAVPWDSALIRWRWIAVFPSKIQDFAEFGVGISSLCEGSWQLDKDQGSPASWRKWVQRSLPAAVPTSQSKHFHERQVCTSERAEASAGTYFIVTHLKLSSWL